MIGRGWTARPRPHMPNRMSLSDRIWAWANPRKFMSLSGALLPWAWGAAILGIGVGLIWGFAFTPDDFRMGSSVKIIYVHVPTAFLAINAWFMMLVASLVWLIRRHHVSALAARAAAPVGLIMTVAALATGAIWGKPMWGTYWAWDPRLTSFLILALFYVGYIALWEAVESPDAAADLTSVLCLVGSVFAVLSRYAAQFWNQGLHQGASLSLDAEENIADVFWVPLVIALAGFGALFVALVLQRTRTEIRARRIHTLKTRARASDETGAPA